MRSIDGHFTIVNEQGNATKLAKELLLMFESMRAPEHIIITAECIEKISHNANKVLIEMIETYIAIIDEKFEKLQDDTDVKSFPRIEKAQTVVVDTTRFAERSSTKRNWKKLDSAQRRLAKELDKAGFDSYTNYADTINVVSTTAKQKKELINQRANYVAQINECMVNRNIISELTPAQIITVIAEVLSHRPKTDVGMLPVVFDDALRDLNADTKLRALELLKAYSTQYATWYVTNDPLVLGWSGFQDEDVFETIDIDKKLYDFELDIA